MNNAMHKILSRIYCVVAWGVFIFLIVPLIALIEPFWHIRIGVLMEDRIGHLAVNTLFFVRRLELHGKPPRTTYIFLCWSPANRQLLTMWKRRLNIVENYWLRRASYCLMPQLEKFWFFENLLINQETQHYECSVGEPGLTFTPEEEARGRAALAEMGIGPDDWFICFHNRDPAYIAERRGMGRQTYSQSFRDCKIENYLPAAQWIADQGGFAIRYGAVVANPLPEGLGPRIVDYPSRYRSDFMDIYLIAKCRFFLGNTSGPVCVPHVFNVYAGDANNAPHCFPGLGRRRLTVPKYLRRISDGHILTFPEIHDLGLFFRPDETAGRRSIEQGGIHAKLGLEWVENDGEDILDLCKSLMDLTSGREPSAEARRLQKIYAGYFTGPSASPYAGSLAHHFALRHRELFGRDAI